MKRILLSLLIASATLLSFNSCTKEYYEDSSTFTLPDYRIAPGDWIDNNTPLAQFSIDVPELTNEIVDFGVVNVSMRKDNSTTFSKLPTTINGISYSVDYDTQEIMIFAEREGGLPVNIDETVVFKVSLTRGR